MAGSALGATRRLFQLWGLYATMDLLYVARGPASAITYYFSDLAVGVAAITATFLLAERFGGIGSWTKPQILFLLGYALLVRGLIATFFNYNLAFISRRIGRGQLDHLLIQPQPLWMGLISEGFAPVTGTGMLIPSAFLLIDSARQLELALSPGWWMIFIVDLAASIAIVLSFEYIWGSLAFWTPRAAEEVNSQTWNLLQTLSPFPLDGLAGWALVSLLTVAPVGLIAWLPSRELLNNDPVSWSNAAPLPAAAVLFVAFATWTFTSGLRHYARTGSSRYLDYGHRR